MSVLVKLVYQQEYEVEVEAKSVDEAVTKAHKKLKNNWIHRELREQDIKNTMVHFGEDQDYRQFVGSVFHFASQGALEEFRARKYLGEPVEPIV